MNTCDSHYYRRKFGSVFILAMLMAFSLRAGLVPVDLRCDYAVAPLGVDSNPPRLFWKLQSNARGQQQTAYEILVSSSPELLAANQGDLWDSGRVQSDDTIQSDYAGRKLNSFQQVFWKVRVWDVHGKISQSKPSTWTMGVLNNSDWHAGWISAQNTNFPAIILRHEFAVRPGLKRALVNICGLGQYELTLNGQKVGDQFLAPGWSKYDQTCLYDTYDITRDLRCGKNAAGVSLGNGMYNVIGGGRFTKFKASFGPQKVIAQIRLEYNDGSVEFIGTDEGWRFAESPVTFSTIYGGEDYDARLTQKGWDKADYDDSKWQLAKTVDGPGGELRGLSCAAPAVHRFEIQLPVASWTLTNGDMVFDLGQNAAHVPTLSLRGPPGSSVKIFPSELTNSDGSISQGSMGAGRRGQIWCQFTKATDGTESWSPSFFYVGCRYLQVHFLPANVGGPLPRLRSIGGIVVHSSSEPVGRFECSNDLFDRTFNLVHWAQQNNMMSILTDCPHRERLGWLEQDHLNGPALRYDFDLAQLFTKILNDIGDSQLPDGLVPTSAPEYDVFRDKNDLLHARNLYGDSPEWSSSFILIPWQQYEFDGDLELFRKHYDGMTNYLAYLGGRATNSILNYGMGDRYDLGPKKPGLSQLTPIALTGTAFYFEDAKIVARAALLLGNEDDAKKYSALAETIRTAFNQKFFNNTNHFYATDSQCANAMPLAFDICEPSNRADVLDAIVRDVRARGNALTAGDVGYRYLLRALADGGRNDVIFDMNDQTNKPGYGMQVAKGKTSLTEAWDGGSSQDHFMLGQIQEWFFHDLAGIQNSPDSAGFKKIIIAPRLVGDVTWTRASYDSIRGLIVSDWKRTGGKFQLRVIIPPGTTAEVFVPAKSASSVTESGQPASQSKDVGFLRMENNCAVFQINSGHYHFEVD
jgi:alpha-L-rhamnosidase